MQRIEAHRTYGVVVSSHLGKGVKCQRFSSQHSLSVFPCIVFQCLKAKPCKLSVTQMPITIVRGFLPISMLYLFLLKLAPEVLPACLISRSERVDGLGEGIVAALARPLVFTSVPRELFHCVTHSESSSSVSSGPDAT